MSAQGDPPTTKDSNVDKGKHAEADAVDSAVLEKEKAHPLPRDPSPYPPGSEDAYKADAINTAVLQLRGYRTHATGVALYRLASIVEDNDLYGKTDQAAAADASDSSDDAVDDVTITPNAFSAAVAAGLRIATGVLANAKQADDAAAIPANSNKSSNIGKNPTLVYEKALHFFFYGSLQDASQLRLVCNLKSPPRLRPASIRGWRVMMWGPFPALVPGAPDDRVDGMVWRCETGRNVMDLCEYESRNYRLERCDIYLETTKPAETNKGRKDEKELEKSWGEVDKRLENLAGGAGGSTRAEELKAEAKAEAQPNETLQVPCQHYRPASSRVVQKGQQQPQPQQSVQSQSDSVSRPSDRRLTAEDLRRAMERARARCIREDMEKENEARDDDDYPPSGPGQSGFGFTGTRVGSGGFGRRPQAEKSEAKDEVNIIRDGRVFVHAGAPGLLKEGSFDLEHWRGLRHIF